MAHSEKKLNALRLALCGNQSAISNWNPPEGWESVGQTGNPPEGWESVGQISRCQVSGFGCQEKQKKNLKPVEDPV
jgi:hypothetical protein